MRPPLSSCLLVLLAGALLGGCGRSSLGTEDTDSSSPSSSRAGGAGGGGGMGSAGGAGGQGGAGASGGQGMCGAEVCDGLDNNCNGIIDDGDPGGGLKCMTGLPGPCGPGTTVCLQGAIFCEEDAPPSPELCNGVDDDCDGTVDPENSKGCAIFYKDADTDGYGVDGDKRCLCAPAGLYTAKQGGDCDDTSATVHPGAFEMCNNVDDNCNGLTDEGFVICGCTSATWSGHDYLFCQMQEAFGAAVATCSSVNYHLASIGSAAENDFIFTFANMLSHEKWWMGFNDIAVEGAFGWQDGSPVTYTNWAAGEPNNAGNEDCGQINRFYPESTWNDEPCNQPLFFICELQ